MRGRPLPKALRRAPSFAARRATPLPGAASGAAMQPLTPLLPPLPDYSASGEPMGADLSGALASLPADDPVRALYSNLRAPTPVPLPAVDTAPQGWQQRVGSTLGASPFHPAIAPHASFLQALALSGAGALGNGIAAGGARSYLASQQAQQDAQSGVAQANQDAVKQYQAQVDEARKAIAAHASELSKAKSLLHPMGPDVYNALKGSMTPDQRQRAQSVGLSHDELADVFKGYELAHPKATGIGSIMGGQDFNPQAIANGIVAGLIPADPAGYSRGQWGVISSFLPQGFDLNAATQASKANKTFVATVNGRQFTMLRAAQKGIVDALKPLWDANEEVAKSAHLTPSSMANRVIAGVEGQGMLGPKAQRALVTRASKAALTVEPLASVLRNGGMPTDDAQALAEQIVSSKNETPPSVLRDQILSALSGLGLREDAFKGVAPAGLDSDKMLRPDPNAPKSQSDPFAGIGVKPITGVH